MAEIASGITIASTSTTAITVATILLVLLLLNIFSLLFRSARAGALCPGQRALLDIILYLCFIEYTMKFPILTSLIIFIVWLTVKTSGGKKDRSENIRSFWEKERAANAVRKKSLDDLPYVFFPFDILPSEESFTVQGLGIPSSLTALKELKEKKIVNLNGYSNTDLKLEYGTTNISILTEYDENFLTLCREGHLLSEYLYDMDKKQEAQKLSEALIQCGSDVSTQFTLLYRIYHEAGLTAEKSKLMQTVEQMTSSRKNAILRALTELEQKFSAEGDADAGSFRIITPAPEQKTPSPATASGSAESADS